MPTYKLMYFNITGLAEAIRYMFHYAGIEFEDVRFETEDWPKYKADMPMGQVPVLEIDGKKYNQSKAIGRYIAKKCNMYSSDDIEALEIDSTVDSFNDMTQILSKHHMEKDPAAKEKLKEVALEKLPRYLDKFEEQVKKNGGHFVGGKLTWPDIIYASYSAPMHEYMAKEMSICHGNYPELKKLADKVNAIPSIKAYLETRPETVY